MQPQTQIWDNQPPQGPPPAWGQQQYPPTAAAWGPPPQGDPRTWPVGQQQQAPAAPAPTPPSPDDFLVARYPGAKFDTIGQVIGGEIVAPPTTKQQTDPATGSLKFYPRSGDPMWQLLVPVRAQEPDGDDDGIRTLYVKNQMRDVVAAAIAKAGATRLEVGGVLQVKLVREEPNPKGGFPKKIHEARYIPPAAGRPVDNPVDQAPVAGAGLAAAREAAAQLQRAHQSSPFLASRGQTPAAPADDDIPF